MADENFSISCASKKSGLSNRQIRYLEEREYIKPDYIIIGNTHQRRYTADMLENLITIARLRESGYELGVAVSIAITKKNQR